MPCRWNWPSRWTCTGWPMRRGIIRTICAAAALHAGRDIGIEEVQWHLDVHLLLLVHALEVDMLHLLAERMHHEIAQQHGLLLAFEVQRQERRVDRFCAQLVVKVVM